MTGSVWRHVVADLRADHRCVVPTLPLGGHRRPMHPDADLSLSGMVRLVADFLDRLNLREVTLVGNDWGGAQLLVTQRRDERVGRLVLAACEAFDNYPPGIPGASRAVGEDFRRDLRHGAVAAATPHAARADVLGLDE